MSFYNTKTQKLFLKSKNWEFHKSKSLCNSPNTRNILKNKTHKLLRKTLYTYPLKISAGPDGGSSSRGSDTFIWPLWTLHICGTQMYIQAKHLHFKKYTSKKISLFFKHTGYNATHL